MKNQKEGCLRTVCCCFYWIKQTLATGSEGTTKGKRGTKKHTARQRRTNGWLGVE